MDIKTTIQVLLSDGFILVFNEDRLDIVKTAGACLRRESVIWKLPAESKNPWKS